jgi:uncharacterized OB-fold protein
VTERFMPVVDDLSAFYWNGAAQEKLLIQRCTSCGSLRFPPSVACPSCQAFGAEEVESAGRGRVWTYCFAVRPKWPFLKDDDALAVVELEEGVRITTNVTGVRPGEIRIGMPVEVWFMQLGEGVALPMFRPAGAPEG